MSTENTFNRLCRPAVLVLSMLGGCATATPEAQMATRAASSAEANLTGSLAAAEQTDPSEKASAVPAPELIEVASFGDNLLTAVAVSGSGRKFVNFPRWTAAHSAPSVAEVMSDGTLKAYPDENWNSWKAGEDPSEKFVCVQSVHVDRADKLWVLDPGAPFFGAALEGGPKLVKIDPATDKVLQTVRFDSSIAPANSYLNDVRIDEDGKFAYVTDSNLGRLVVVDLEAGRSRVVLDKHASMMAEDDVVPTIEGIELRLPAGKDAAPGTKGPVFKVNSDGIAVANGHVYYHAVTGRNLYRIPSALLRDSSKGDEELAAGVEKVAETGIHDGMESDVEGNIYFTQLEDNAITVLKTDGTIETVIQDDRIQWPDSLAVSSDGYLYMTISQVHLLPLFNGGKDMRKNPYRVFKVKL